MAVAWSQQADIVIYCCSPRMAIPSPVMKLSTSWCLQLLEILEICWNLYVPPGYFCIKCRWSTALVSSHYKTGYQTAYLRKWSPFFIFATAPCCTYHVFVLYLGKLVDLVHCIAGQSNAIMSWIFLEMPSGISWKAPGKISRSYQWNL